jgi:site-specific recombinase XerD
MQTNSLHTNTPNAGAPNAGQALGDYPQRFKAHLEGQGYTRSTVATYVHCIEALGRLMHQHAVGLGDLDEAHTATLLAQAPSPLCRCTSAKYVIRLFVRFLRAQGVPMPVPIPTPKEIARADLRREYEEYLRRQRGLSERTIPHCWRLADRFLEFRFGDAVGNLAEITLTDIAGFLQHVQAQPRPNRSKSLSTHLRTFFRYLFQAGKIATNLAAGIPSVAQRYGARLPRHLTAEQVETLLAAVRSDTPQGRRNYAMALLLARLGLRAQEVIALQLEDIDWRAGELLVRGKGQRHDRVPLPQDVGEALADYVRLDRVTTSRVIFVTDRAPHRPFKGGQMVNAVLKEAFAKTGLKPPAPYVGSHVLRHSLAVQLVQRGASLDEVSDVLRHRSRVSTMIYAKLDVGGGLRSVAQPWPVTGGAQ